MLTLSNVNILIISPTGDDGQEMKTFMARMPFDNLFDSNFVIGKIVPTDDFHFAIFDARKLPRINKDTILNTDDAAYLQLFREYLKKPIKYILYYGEFLYDLDRERCPSANSKFTLFARIRELIDFLNHYERPKG